MLCSNCGASAPDTATFCTNCGSPLSNPRIAGAPSTGVAPPPPMGGPAQAAAVPPQPIATAPQPASPWINVPPEAQQTDGKAVGSLICGILSVTIFWILAGIPAVILGHMSLSSIKKSMGRLKGNGMAIAGLVMGYISVAFIPFMLIIAAIAIPNLMRSRLHANDSAAAANIRTIITAQVMYSTTYPAQGYARDLATLGPGPSGTCAASGASQTYNCQLDSILANASCTGDAWCTKDAFRYRVSGVCEAGGVCSDFLVIGIPLNSNTGTKSYCATSDAVVRFKLGVVESLPTTAAECLAWDAL